MPFEIIRNDITKLKVDAIVNAANKSLRHGGGVCGAIFLAAGKKQLKQECKNIGCCKTGESVITKGFNLPAKFIIHTVGPVWRGGKHGERDLLYACYKNSLELAKENQIESIAFPLISSGAYGYPKDQALRTAVTAIGDFLLENDMAVSLAVFDKDAYSLSEKLYSEIKTFIDDNYADSNYISRRTAGESQLLKESISFESTAFILEADEKPLSDNTMPLVTESLNAPPIQAKAMPAIPPRSLNDIINHMDETFSERLLRLIDERGCNDTYVYKRANIDRRVFSKIRSNKDYKPSKNTAIAFAVALELSLDDTRDLLMKAGFALSRSNKLDVIVEYFITEKNYNIFEINEALFAFDQSLLGA